VGKKPPNKSVHQIGKKGRKGGALKNHIREKMFWLGSCSQGQGGEHRRGKENRKGGEGGGVKLKVFGSNLFCEGCIINNTK